MENASKALIIAGAILLSILIIGLGMTVYNNSKDVTSDTGLDQTKIRAFNSQLLQYEGKQSGSNVKQLLNAIKVNNRDYEDRRVLISADNIEGTGAVDIADIAVADTSAAYIGESDINTYTDILASVKSSTTYFVTFAERDDGLIGGVEIHIYSDEDK